MDQYDIAPARKRLGVTAREVEAEMCFPLASLGAIEDGRIGIDSNTYKAIHAAIQAIADRKKEPERCEMESATTASV